MASTGATAGDDGLPKKSVPYRPIMTSFRPLASISEQEQEHLISLAMEATGLKQYQRWDAVEYTIIDSIKNGWHMLLQKAKQSLTGKKPAPDAEPNETHTKKKEDGEGEGEGEEQEGAMVIVHMSSDNKKPKTEVDEEEGEEGWTFLR